MAKLCVLVQSPNEAKGFGRIGQRSEGSLASINASESPMWGQPMPRDSGLEGAVLGCVVLCTVVPA